MTLHKLHEFIVKLDPLVPSGEIHVAAETYEKLKDRVTGVADPSVSKPAEPQPEPEPEPAKAEEKVASDGVDD